ncbi:MAG: archaemetzincin family Zn-dependent metalloprotease [Bacteroidales bacterium]
MDQGPIALISFGQFEVSFLEKISGSIVNEYHHEVRIHNGHLDLSEFYDATRGQYNANKLLKEVDANFSSGNLKTFGLFNVDLYVPILTYIFGQAFLNGRTGIASLYRFNNERYGIKMDEEVIFDRFKKTIIHELGHTFGLVHCYMPDCVMRSSTYVEDVDQKSQHLCGKCRDDFLHFIHQEYIVT